MRLTRNHLRTIIKEELSRLSESNGDDYLNGQRAKVLGIIRDSIVQIANSDDIEISRSAMEGLDVALENGEWRVSQKSNPTSSMPEWAEPTAVIDWEVEGLADALEDAGVPPDLATQFVDDLGFVSAISVIQSAFDKEFGEGAFDALEVDDTFSDASELSATISSRIKTPASKKEYTGPKGKGQTRYIVTSQLASWHGEGDPDYDTSVFYLVDTVDGTKFEVRGDELPYILPTTEGEIEIFDMLPSSNSRESHLVADLNGKEFRLARKDI